MSPFQPPLNDDEVISLIRDRLGATYDLQLAVRRDRLYLQLMWAYLEQQSFPMDEEAFRTHVNEVLEVINRLGLAGEVRNWLATINKKPRQGKALSLRLRADGLLKEFLLD